MTARLIIADDHWVVRHALRSLLMSRTDLEIVGEAADGQQAILMADALTPDLMILDISLPVMSGMQVLETFRTKPKAPFVLVFSMHPTDQYMKHVVALGAKGFLSKDAPAATIIAAIDTILLGKTAFPLEQQTTLALRGTPNNKVLGALSRREDEVLRALVQGERNGDIAKRLSISAKTVSTYRARIFEKLNVESDAELVALTGSISQYQ
jgi:DNA-binding NarL/FixJ family response regulator